MNANVIFRRFSVLLSAAIFVSLGAIAQAQTHPNLFRQRPVTATPGSHGVAADGDCRYDSNETKPAPGCVICAHGIVAHLAMEFTAPDLLPVHSPLLSDSPSESPVPSLDGTGSTRGPPVQA